MTSTLSDAPNMGLYPITSKDIIKGLSVLVVGRRENKNGTKTENRHALL